VRAGFVVISQMGRHVKLRSSGPDGSHTVILKHPRREVPLGTFRDILDQAGLTHEQLDQLM
jgi:predicted RNA binding protein YcfA (HicA-like mRNA interferase family)